MSLWRYGLMQAVAAVLLIGGMDVIQLSAQQINATSTVQRVDAAVYARIENIDGYTAKEHYAVFRNHDETHPVAEMTVQTVYRKKTGKSYTILSQSGSTIVRKLVLNTILDHEKLSYQPGNREGALLTSANYQMRLKPEENQHLGGRDCLAFALAPKRKAPNLIEGTLWVDAKDYSIVQVQGTATKSSSIFTGPTRMTRQYTIVSGFPQAIHARAVSKNNLLGETIVTIDYSDYRIQLHPNKG
jgi:hypothetical protein